MKLKALIILALAISACGGASTTSTVPTTSVEAGQALATLPEVSQTEVVADYNIDEMNDTRCGKWLDEGRTVNGLIQMVKSHPGYDWKYSRDFDQNGYPCEDEIGVGYLPTTTTTTQATTTTTRPPTTTTSTTRPPTTTTTEVASSPLADCVSALGDDFNSASIQLANSDVGIGDVGDSYFRLSLRECSESEWAEAMRLLVLWTDNITCDTLNTIYYAAEVGSRLESRMLDAWADCVRG